MNHRISDASEQEQRLDEVATAYLKAQEAGQSPDRQALLDRHPELAAELREFFADQERLANLVGPLQKLSEAEPELRVLGDFRIIREVGRGGMGVVYEAEQVSLRRRVALKVLPFAATMDPRHLRRFQNEAQAAACLHHTNIVPVYSVGSERGVHFYAMQFIEGQPLSELIRQLAQGPEVGAERTIPYQAPPGETVAASPTVRAADDVTPLTGEGKRGREYFRKVAELGMQAAEALDHAHQLGIVHRDIKPGNLLLDGRGNLWVTDFGLAQVQHGEGGLTMTGDLVGTLRYMSPEQALAQRVVIDHRTDIYSLGATLYELLTLRPAFGGNDRQELLRQIAFDEPPRPRRLNKAIPVELETIVLKAMEKRPQDRYATAQALADDLRHWLEDRPIRARRPSLAQRLRKWSRRHPGVAWAAIAVLLVVTVATSLSTAVMQRAQLRTQAALAAESKRRQQARDALDAMTSQLMEDWLSKQEAVLPEHKVFLEKALTFYEEFAADTGQDEAARAGVAVAHLRVGSIRAKLGQSAEAEEALVRARQLYVQLVADFPTVPAYRKGLADSYYEFGVMLLHMRGRPKEAEEACRAAVTFRQQLVAEFPAEFAYRFDLSLSQVRLGSVLESMSRLEEAEQAYRAALTLREQLAAELPTVPRYRLEVAGSQIDLAFVLQNTGRLKEAEERMPGAVAAYQQYATDFPTAENRWFLAWAYHRQANLLSALGRPKEAEKAHRASLAIGQQLAAEFPTVLKYRMKLAADYNNLGRCLEVQGLLDEAVTQFRKAILLHKADAVPHWSLGNALLKKGRLDEAIDEYRQAIRLKKEFHEVHCNLGNALLDKGRLDEAITELREAIRIKKDYAEAHCSLGDVLAQKGQFAEALVHGRIGHELGSKNPRWPYPFAQWVRDCERLVELDGKLSAILSGQKEPADAAERLGLAQLCQMPCKKQNMAAQRFYREAFTQQPQLAEDRNAQHRYNAACAAALAGCGQGNDADKLDTKERARLHQQALDWLRADLKAYRQLMEKNADKAGPEIAQRMQHWLQDADYAGVRGAAALGKLPEAERLSWQKLWQEVEALRQRAAGKPAAASPARH